MLISALEMSRKPILCPLCRNGGAVSADVTSANTVGYITATLKNGDNRTFSLTLNDVGNPTAPVRIDKLLTIDNIKTVPGFGDAMDQIWRWDTTINKWAKYGYQKPSRGGTAAWRKYNAADESFSDLTDADVVTPGETFLYYRGNDDDCTLTLAGQVKEFGIADVGYTFQNGDNKFVAYPWPVAIKVGDIPELATFSSIKTVPGFGDAMDQIWRWDTTINKWAKYGYQKPSRGGTAAWRKYNPGDESFSDLTDADVIAAGEGFLYYRGNDEDLTLVWKPLKSAE